MAWYERGGHDPALRLSVIAALSKLTVHSISTTDLMHALGASIDHFNALAAELKLLRMDHPELVDEFEGMGAFGKTAYRWRLKNNS